MDILDRVKQLQAIFEEGPRSMNQEPRNMYSEGQLVTPSVDGSRPGYNGREKKKTMVEQAEELGISKSALRKPFAPEIEEKIIELHQGYGGKDKMGAQAIADELGLNRSSVGKRITALKKEGIIKNVPYKERKASIDQRGDFYKKPARDKYLVVREVRDIDKTTKWKDTGELKYNIPKDAKFKIDFKNPGVSGAVVSDIPEDLRGIQYFKTKKDTEKALKKRKALKLKADVDLYEVRRSANKKKYDLVKEVSNNNIEELLTDFKKGQPLEQAHRLSLNQVKKTGELYNVMNLGLDFDNPKFVQINNEFVKPYENKLKQLYKEQDQLYKKASKLENIPKELRKQIAFNNKKISTVVDLSGGRVQGLQIDEFTLKPKTYGINYANVLGFGMYDKPVKDLTKIDRAEIGAIMQQQIENEKRTAGATAKKLFANTELLNNVDDLTIRNLEKIPKKEINEQIKLFKQLGYKCKLSGGAGESVACYMSDVEKTRADMKSSDVTVRAKALTKQRKALKLASKIPQIGKIIKTGVQLGTAAITKPLQWLGLTSGLGYAIEGIVEGGFYDNARRKGYNHQQAMAETFSPGLIAGRPEGVPWYGGAEALREKELYEIKGKNEFIDVENRPPMQDQEFEKVIGTKGKVKQYIEALKDQDRIYDAFARKEQGTATNIDQLTGTEFQRKDILDKASADIRDLAKTGTMENVNRIMNPESMASQAYNTAVENRDALQQKRRTEYLEKYDPRALEREKKSFDIYARDKEGKILYEKMNSRYKQRYKDMEKYKKDRKETFGFMTPKDWKKYQTTFPKYKNIPYEHPELPKFANYMDFLESKPEGYDKTYKELFPTPASRYDWDLSGEVARAGGVANMATGGRAGYMGGGITAIRKPNAIPPERQGLRSILINGKKS